MQHHIGVLLRNHFESLYEKINPLMPRDLADEEKIPLRREFLADFGIPEWALVWFLIFGLAAIWAAFIQKPRR